MKVCYHIPSLYTIYAGRTIYHGYKNAFVDLGHDFITVTVDDNFTQILNEHRPDLLITGLNPFYLKYIDHTALKNHRQRGMRVFVSIPLWHSPLSRLRISEPPSLSENKKYVELIRSGNYGDVFFNVCDSEDERTQGFERATGYPHICIPLAADKTLQYPDYAKRFEADISYIGTNLSEKKKFFRKQVFPLSKKYSLKLYGQNWTLADRVLSNFQKIGQYYNISYLRSLIKPKLQLEDERKIYTSSLISINVHEDYQKRFGGDCNERTFKIPACGGFEITDDVACIRKYFKEGEEIIIAKNKDDWFEKIDYYIRNPEKRLPIIEAGRKKVLAEHTYHKRVEQMMSIYHSL